MKKRKRTKFPLLSRNMQNAILECVLSEDARKSDSFIERMEYDERRFYEAVLDLGDAYGPNPEPWHRMIIEIKRPRLW